MIRAIEIDVFAFYLFTRGKHHYWLMQAAAERRLLAGWWLVVLKLVFEACLVD